MTLRFLAWATRRMELSLIEMGKRVGGVSFRKEH